MKNFSILSHLDKLTPARGKNRYHCPVCGGNNLTIDPKTGEYQCWSGCNVPEIRNAIAPLPGRGENAWRAWTKPPRPKRRREWTYCDRNGQPLIRVNRTDSGDGEKRIWQESLVEGKGAKDLLPLVMPYRYQDCLAAIERGERVLWVEGETTADALWGTGIAATTTIRGSDGYSSQYAGLFPAESVVICPDRDKPGLKYAEAIAHDYPRARWLYAEPDHPEWQNIPTNGGYDLQDWIAAGATSEQILKSIEVRRVTPTGDDDDFEDDFDFNAERAALGQSSLAAKFAEQNRDRFCYSLENEDWFTYHQGYWKHCKRWVIERELIKIVKETQQSFKSDLIRGAAYLSQLELGDREWNRDRRYLPLKNGVFDVQTRQLIGHSPDLNLRWQLPYDYQPQAQCPTIQAWLLEACGNDLALMQLLRAYLNAILLGRVDLQKYLELVGPGGTGKSTLIRLAMALVGTTNTFTTELKRLEQNRFEAAGIVGKRLIVITDSEHYSGQVSILKAITGQDSIPLERKYKDPDPEGLIPDAMVIVASNETIVSGDYTSGLARRRLTVPFLNRIPDGKQRDLISWNGGRVSGEFVEELPGLLNWVLELSPEQVTATIKNATNESETLAKYRVETLLNSNPIADWLDEHVIVKVGSRVYIGSAKKIRVSVGDKDTGFTYYDTYECCNRWLYANYADHCLKVGAKVIGGKRFVPLLKDLLQHQLGIQIHHAKDKYGFYIEGIALRGEDKNLPRPISEQSSTPANSQSSETLQASFLNLPSFPSPEQFSFIPPTSVLGLNHKTDVQGMKENVKGEGLEFGLN